ncbi:MAG TPA: SDR family oxidoreductase [Polyangiales bacterium]|nr:SDR family oxidoreductase [Polyangiales bacterium]
MTGRFSDRVVIITGGASGIGRASALKFLAEGARVVIGDLNQAKAEETLQLAAAVAPAERACFQSCDVSDEAQVAALVERARREFGRLDCMFNNAGLPGAVGPLEAVSVEDWDRTFAVLVRGVFLGIKHATPLLRERGGTIVNTASIAGLNAGAGATAYSTCKAAVIGLTRSAAVELAPARIRVNALCPGLVLTPLLDRSQTNELETVLSKAQPWPEAGLPEHIADAALFLASDDSRFVTGEALVVDGGITARGPGVFARDNPVGKAIAKNISRSLSDRRSATDGAINFDPGTSD